jgi:hypothetical protein
MLVALGQQAERRPVTPDGDVTAHAQAAPEPAGPARILPEAVGLDPERIGRLQDLRRRVQGVGHVDVDAVHPVRAGAAAEAAGLGLVERIGRPVPGVGPAEGDVVHRPLTARDDAVRVRSRECPEHDVGHALGGL